LIVNFYEEEYVSLIAVASADYGRCQRAKPWTCGDNNVLVKCYSNRIKKNHHLNFSKKRTNYRIGRGAKKQEGRNKQAKEQQVAQLADRKRQLPGRRPPLPSIHLEDPRKTKGTFSCLWQKFLDVKLAV